MAATGLGLNLDSTFLLKLQQADDYLNKLLASTEKLTQTTVTAFQTMAKRGVVPYIKELTQQKQLMDEIANAKNPSRNKVFTQMKADAKDASREIERVIKALQKTKAYKDDASGKSAIGFANKTLSAKGDKSIDNLRLAISKLEQAQNRQNLNTKTGQANFKKLGDTIKRVKEELDKATGAADKHKNKTKQVKQEQDKLINTSNKLANRFATLFSVQAIIGYVKKIIEVRGEFEMQHRAMQTLIGDVDEANKLWDKTVALAVKSPFRVRQLVTYTKQLSAYRIETEKLYDKTKMLADISAGLGVDMNRLILAYGQVKAANYLRGTELRQFSEAGINILKELSVYFTELEGRAVSVGDVFERVSKRMVSFADVDAVLQRVTGEGGTFYQMQEKQAETLKGLMMNLSDSLDLMLNALGKRNDSTLKSSIALVRMLIERWRMLEPVIAAAGTALLIYFPLSKLKSIGTSLKNIFTFKGAAHPYAAAIAAVTSLLVLLNKAIHAQSRLNAAMTEVDMDVRKQLQEQIGLYKKLTGTILDVTSTTDEYEKAQKQLREAFSDIIENSKLEADYIKQTAGDYRNAEQALLSYYNTKAKELKKDRIRQHYDTDIQTDVNDLVTSFSNAINDSKFFSDETKEILLGSIGGAVGDVIKDIEDGKIKPENILSAVYDRMERFTGMELKRRDFQTSQWGSFIGFLGAVRRGYNADQLERELKKKSRALETVEGLPFETYNQKVFSDAIIREKEILEEVIQGYKDAVNVYSAGLTELRKEGADSNKVWADILKKRDDILARFADDKYHGHGYYTLLYDTFDELKQAAEVGTFEFNAALQIIEKELIQGANSVLSRKIGEIPILDEASRRLYLKELEKLTKKATDLRLTAFQEAAVKGARSIAEKHGLDYDIFSKYVPKTEDSRQTMATAIKADYENTLAIIKQFETSLEQEMPELTEDVIDVTSKRIEQMRLEAAALKDLAEFYGVDFKEKTKKDNKLIDERIRVIDNMNKKYRELRETLSNNTAIKGAFDAYKDAFQEAYKGTIFIPTGKDVSQMTADEFVSTILNFPNRDDVVLFLNELAEETAELDDKIRVELAKGGHVEEMKVEREANLQKKALEDIEKLFGNYEVSLELDKLNIPPNLANKLFGVESINLTELRNKILAVDTKNWGLKALEEYDKFLKKVTEMEEKEQMERLKTYTEYAQKSIGERAKIKLEELRKLAEIEKTFRINEGDSDEIKFEKAEIAKRAAEKARKEADDAIKKLDWQDFQKSETFVGLFKDLDSASTSLVQNVLNDLKKFKDEWSNIPVSEMKEMISKITELESKLYESSKPWDDYKKSIERVKNEAENFNFSSAEAASIVQDKPFDQRSFMDALELEQIYQEKRIQTANEEIARIEVVTRLLEGDADAEKEILNNRDEYAHLLHMTGPALAEELKNQNAIVKSANLKLDTISKITVEEIRQIKALELYRTKLDTIQGFVNDLYESFKGLYEALGGSENSTVAILGEMSMSMFDTVTNTLMLQAQLKAAAVEANALGIAMNTAAGPIGWIVMAVQLLAQGIKAITDIKKKNIQAEIDKQLREVDRLRKAYDKLSDEIDNAFRNVDLTVLHQELDRVYDESIKAIDAAIAAAEAHKKVQKALNGNENAKDSQEWKDYQELLKKREDLTIEHAEKVESIWSKGTAGIFDDILNTADTFVSAWYDAFKETGDGLSGLEEEFDSMFVNLAKRQAALTIVGTMVDKWKEELKKYYNPDEGDYDLTSTEIAEWANKVKDTFPELSRLLTDFFNNVDWLTEDGSGLTGLQSGISGMTEEQADILAAYWNAVRLSVSNIDTKFDESINAIKALLIDSDSATENPIVYNLKSILAQATAINTLLNEVRGGSLSNSYIKVQLV